MSDLLSEPERERGRRSAFRTHSRFGLRSTGRVRGTLQPLATCKRTAFHRLLEPAQIRFDFRFHAAADEPRDIRADLAARRVILERDTHFGAVAKTHIFKVHRTCCVDLPTRERAPSDEPRWL